MTRTQSDLFSKSPQRFSLFGVVAFADVVDSDSVAVYFFRLQVALSA